MNVCHQSNDVIGFVLDICILYTYEHVHSLDDWCFIRCVEKFGLSPCNAVNMLYSEGAVNGLREQCHVMLLQEEREAGQCPKKSDIIWWPAVGSLNCGEWTWFQGGPFLTHLQSPWVRICATFKCFDAAGSCWRSSLAGRAGKGLAARRQVVAGFVWRAKRSSRNFRYCRMEWLVDEEERIGKTYLHT